MTRRTRQEPFARSIVAGFCATVTTSVAFSVAYLALMLVAGAPGSWTYDLIHNRLVSTASSHLYVALAVHFCVGIAFAVAYAYWVEPPLRRLGWKSGVLYSLLPWLLSVVVFFPLMGAGLFGYLLAAGPLPAIGNLVLHLCYGATLGVVYGPAGEAAVVRDEQHDAFHHAIVRGTSRGGAFGLLGGSVLGCVAAVLLAVALGASTASIAGMPVNFIYLSLFLGGSSLGLLVGLWLGIPAHCLSRSPGLRG